MSLIDPMSFHRFSRKVFSRGKKAFERKPSTWGGYTSDALQLAQIFDCTMADMAQQQQHPERVAQAVHERVCNWYLPSFENPFYGGIMTVLRMADYLYRTHCIKQRFLICGSAKKEEVRQQLTRCFEQLAFAEIIILDSSEAVSNIPASDYSIASIWTTAYALLGIHNTGLKFYLIQDFEPTFYPAGSTYAQAELTYGFGFYGIANTQSLKDVFEKSYGGTAVLLKPNIDKTVFFPDNAELPHTPKRLFYYARPGTPRNGFELAIAALKLVKARHGAEVDIVCACADWEPAKFGLDGVVRAIGLQPYYETGDLYRSCHVGFVLLMTQHPTFLPLELMACGSLLVTNFNEANAWLLKDGENCLLSMPSASCLAETLSFALDQYESLEAIRTNASETVMRDFADWDSSYKNVAAFMLAPPSLKSSDPLRAFFASQKNTRVI
jgi:glycosyltransferase involved in cell wall biosynthesis